MSRHQEQLLKAARDLSGCRDKTMMSRHHKRSTETCEGTTRCHDIKNDQFTTASTLSGCRDMRSMSRHGCCRDKEIDVAT